MEIATNNFYPARKGPIYDFGQRNLSVWKQYKKQQLAIDIQRANQRIFSFQVTVPDAVRRRASRTEEILIDNIGGFLVSLLGDESQALLRIAARPTMPSVF
jgi:hypothetical protein